MPWFRFNGVRSFIKIHTIWIHHEELAIPVFVNLSNHSRAWLSLMLTAW